jgi:acetolactate synthase-1/2/3 large subunit
LPDTVGDLVAAFLERNEVGAAFGVISIHNMPILDAIARRNRVRFVPARGEAGALNMADAFARVSGGLGVGITSTGVGAGNAAGSLVEAHTAGSPVLHITGQVELAYLDRARGYIHEAVKQPEMLAAVSKAAFRIWSAQEALGVLRQAAITALTPPQGPVSVEIPIDVQGAAVDLPPEWAPSAPGRAAEPAREDFEALETALRGAQRPLLWLGGGARDAAAVAAELAGEGFGIVTSVHGRGTVSEAHPMSLGAFNASPAVESFYKSCDLMIVAGSRLRGNETFKQQLVLPPLAQIDIDPAMAGRAYPSRVFVHGDARATLARVRDGWRKPSANGAFAQDLAAAHQKARADLRASLGPDHARIADAVREHFPRGAGWVRDITLANSSWGNRYAPVLEQPDQGLHALGGGIGQGLPMAIGAALAAPERKTVALIGDGGFMLGAGELATAVQERTDITIILMNDRGYGVIRNIQDAQFGGRRPYVDLHTPDFALLSRALGLPHWRVAGAGGFADAFAAALAVRGPAIVEVDVTALAPYARPFAGPPVRVKE